ncbi:MAG TPA: 4-hydroxy-3-methylbut-2-enyl diphosphate reductase [Acidimicrobiales bacterium]|nr:4-hydroxy-3-methylbut-2-enyl diphosphate reductase [Acidimicrobiales bacterium]
MAELRVLSALRIEGYAVGGEVLLSGMGPDKAQRAPVRHGERLAGEVAVAVAGVSGGLDPTLRPGDVVVATELRCTDGRAVRPIPSAALVAADLAATGLVVRAGPIVSSPTFVPAEGRAALGASGALAVDMESAWFGEALDSVPLSVVRTIADTTRANIVTGGPRALASLMRIRPTLERWARATGPRQVLLAAPRSFCAGVERAIEIVERALDRYGAPVFVRRQIVHNAHVVAGLEARGAVFVEELDEVPDHATVVIAAHGVSPEVRSQAAARDGISVIDATCPLVAKVHHEARRFASQGRQIVLIGHAEHEEVVGTMGEAPDGIHLVEGPDDVERLAFPPDQPVAYLTQTTLATDETAEVVSALRARFPAIVGPSADDICYATQNRQDAVRALASDCDLVLVVGSANSSNTARLVEVAQREGCRAELIEDAGELRLGWLFGAGTIGLTAGASAPDLLVHEVLNALSTLGPVEVTERRVTQETVRFALPPQVR